MILLLLLAVTVVILVFQVSAVSRNLNYLQDLQKRQYERLLEEITGGRATTRMDLGLPAMTARCISCLQVAAGDPRAHRPWCRFSQAAAVRDWKQAHPGEPLPEGVEDP